MKINLSCINCFNTEKIPDAPSANTGNPLSELPGETNKKRRLGRLLSTLHEPRKAAFHAWRLRLSFGRSMESGILSHEIATKSSGNTPLMQIMQQYAHDIGSNLSAQEIERYINIGEHLVRAITQGRLQEDNKLRIPKENGGERIVHSNLETARAISWYLQAKGVMDHASPDLDPHLLNRGSMLVADKDSHLFRFLNSAPNTHGRISTHFNERSTSEPATFSNTGVLGKAGSLFSPSATAQRAIEDFSKRMPSGKGNMTFDRLQEDDGTPLLFLKWETVGVPTALGNVRHVDKEDGFQAALSAQIKTFGRNAAHCVNLVQHSLQKGGNGPNWGIRREDVHRGAAEPLYNKFKAIVQDEGKEWSEITIKDGKEKGLYHIKEVLENLKEEYQALSHLSDHQTTQLAGIGTLLEEIKEFERKMGKDLGINRKGSEMHVSLDMSYLDRETVAKSVSPEQPNGKTMQDRNGKFLRKLRKELNLRSENYSPLAHVKAAVSDIKSKVSHTMDKNASLVMDLSGQELKKVVTESLSSMELNEISTGQHTRRDGRPGRLARTVSVLNAATREQTKRKQLRVHIEEKLTRSESFGSITPQNLRTWREKNRTLKTAEKDKFESLTPANAGKVDSPEIDTPKMSLADWLHTDPIENSAKQGFAKADSRRITGEETDEEEIYEDDRTSFSSKDYSSKEEPGDQVSASKSTAHPALGRALNSSPSKWEKDVLEPLKKHTHATDKWIRENNYAVVTNRGSGMNCLLIALLQHATGRYNDQHEQQAQEIRAQLEESHKLVVPDRMLSVFSNDDPILRDAVKIINDLHKTSLDPVIVYPTEDGHPNKGREDDKIETASQKNLIVYGRHGDLHFEALKKMPAATV